MTRHSPAQHGFTLIELTVVLAAIGVLAAILFPVFAQARGSARKAACGSHLEQMGLALHLYARDNDGHFPPADQDLSPLLQSRLGDPSLFRCPDDWLPEADAGNPPHYFSYQYRGGLTLEDNGAVPLAADWEMRHSGGANVLYLDGRVKFSNAGGSAPFVPVTRGPRPVPPGITARSTQIATPFINEPNRAVNLRNQEGE